jgi:hypothetical protein
MRCLGDAWRGGRWVVCCWFCLTCAVAAPAADDASAEQGLLVVEAAEPSLWSRILATVNGFGQIVLPESPVQVARRIGKAESPFWRLLVESGYELSEVRSSTGLFPGTEVRFRLARELTEADRVWVERALERDLRADGTLSQSLQRSILLMLLDASATGSFVVEELWIDLGFLPDARLLLKVKRPAVAQEAPFAMLRGGRETVR